MRFSILFIVGIVAILAFGISTFLSIEDSGYDSDRRVVAMNDVRLLSIALDAYHSEYRTYPNGNLNSIIKQLNGNNPKKLVFLELEKRKTSSDGLYLDPWKHPYQINLNELEKPHIWSMGKNGKDETTNSNSDDICSW